MIELLAPAKLNLGLELLRRRPDGFHEIRSILVPVSLVDRLRVTTAESDRLTTGGLPVATDANIVSRAVALARAAWDLPPLDVTLTKRIPPACGLGGGSSDAAATLVAAARLAGRDRAGADVVAMAACLGSDVPFFLTGGPALVSGRGERARSLSVSAPLNAVIVVPPVVIPAKTATLYGRISADDFSDGSDVTAIGTALSDLPAHGAALPNAFRRPLYALAPQIVSLSRTIQVVSELPVNLSGAGPAHYVICRDAEHASTVATRLRSALRCGQATVYAVRSVAGVQLRGDAA